MLVPNDKSIRTQITLTKKIKSLIEEHARRQNESLSEYLRKAALIRLQLERNEREEREKVADQVIGSIDMTKHPEWSSERKIYEWSRKIREDKL